MQRAGNHLTSNENAEEESKQVEAPNTLKPALVDRMNALSDILIEQRKQMKPPETYPQREAISGFREALNGTLNVASQGATIDTLDVSTAESGAILATTSANEIKILDRNGALSETIPIDKRVRLAKFAPKSDRVAIFVFEKGSATEKQVAQVWNL